MAVVPTRPCGSALASSGCGPAALPIKAQALKVATATFQLAHLACAINSSFLGFKTTAKAALGLVIRAHISKPATFAAGLEHIDGLASKGAGSSVHFVQISTLAPVWGTPLMVTSAQIMEA